MRVVLDACVLYPTVMRRLLLAAADGGAIVPLWSPRITEEWVRAVGRTAPQDDLSKARIEATLLNDRYPTASRAVPENMIEPVLPDPNDDHVLALARHAEARAIVTFNHKDFPTRSLARFGVLRIDPDALLLDALTQVPAGIEEATAAILQDLNKDGESPITLKTCLKRARLPRLAKAMDRRFS